MLTRLVATGTLLLLLTAGSSASPRIVQSLTIDFPTVGRVQVQAREEVGEFPSMLFVAQKTGQVLLHSIISDKEKWLIPSQDDVAPPALRFRVIRSAGFPSPLVMTVGVFQGGSDCLFFLTVFGESEGQISRLNDQPFLANIQGGYYLGLLNQRLGYGLAVWNFIWGDETHYDAHKYEVALYRLQAGKFVQVKKTMSKRKYSGNGTASLREIGINAYDQRRGIPKIKNSLE